MIGAGAGAGGPGWIVCQLGAREHYVLPRALHACGRLDALFTDIWARPGTFAARLPGGLGRRVAERYAPGLDNARIEDLTAAALGYEARQRLRRVPPMAWSTLMQRNAWFQRAVVARFARTGVLREKPVVFAYSYAALDILRAGKAAGCMTVLGQIDPAITEEDIVASATDRQPDLQSQWQRAPASYWAAWREECAVADRIVVNSPWSRDGLVAAGIDPGKLRVVPLAYEDASEGASRDVARDYPARFDTARPLRILFLGSLIIRKGIAELIAATRLLRDAPVEFHLVGPTEIVFPADVVANPNVVLHGPASRGAVAAHYAGADAFILPSLSDGFGLTMLEAMARGVPVIASRHCGDVVTDGVDGVLLDAISGDAITTAIQRLLFDPARLPDMARAARARVAAFRPELICDALIGAIDAR